MAHGPLVNLIFPDFQIMGMFSQQLFSRVTTCVKLFFWVAVNIGL